MDVYIQHLTGGSNTTVTELSRELGRRLDTSKEAILRTLCENDRVYERAIAEADKAQLEISELLRGVDDMQALLGDERSGIHARLVNATENETRLRVQLQDNSAVLACLRLLARLNASLYSMDALIREGRLDQAAEMLVSLERELSTATIIGNTRISDVLANRVELAKEGIRHNAITALQEVLVVRVDDGLAQLSVSTGTRKLEQGSYTQSLFAALDTLGAQDEALAAYSAHFVKSFISPVLASPAISLATHSADMSTRRFEVRRDGLATHVSSTADVCAIVVDAFVFANQALLPDYPASDSSEKAGRLASLWAPESISAVAKMVVERCLLRSIPTARHELEELRRTTDVLLEFESRLFALGSVSASDISNRPIHTAVGRLDDLFIERRCDHAQSRARELAEDTSFALFELERHEVWSLDFVREKVGDSGCGISPLLAEACEKAVASASGGASADLVYPKCSISRSMHRLVSEAYALVNEATLSSDVSASSCLLLGSARQTFDLYGALYLTLHRAQLTKIPALAWQFFNDCMYASHHAGTIAQLIPSLSPTPSEGKEAWLETARHFFGVGSAHIADLVVRESRELGALIGNSSSSRNAFYNAASDAAKEQLEKSRKQVRLAVTQLARAMQPPVVTPRIYYQTLGHYIDAVFAATIEMVAGIRDIGVDDSQVLSDHCRSICSLSDLFRLDSHILAPYQNLLMAANAPGEHGVSVELDELLDSDGEAELHQSLEGRDVQSSVQSARLAKEHCKLSSKLAQLADILLISRADILARRRAGLLAQFTADELIGLIRALFSDTNERAQDIDTLRSLDQ
ncbi:Centromere/kinetochore protein zw10 [Coemansia sp. IMI 209128]|nr:Centromere/kinetochore protein zw10 [Coemansia sp. IMI 209128]